MSVIPKKIRRLLVKIKFLTLFLTLKFISSFELIRLKILKPPVGTEKWLVLKELEYGGYVTNMPRNVVSNKDSKTKEQILWGGMEGGDRMIRAMQKYMLNIYNLSFDGENSCFGRGGCSERNRDCYLVRIISAWSYFRIGYRFKPYNKAKYG